MKSPSYIGLLRSNDHFRLLWLGQVVSFFGDWFKTIALFAIVQELTGSATAVAAVLIAKTLPMFLVLPIVGPLIDRFDRRMLMLVADGARAILVCGLVVAWRLESLWILFPVLVLITAFSGLFMPARTACIPQLMQDDSELPVAMALGAGTWSVMLSFGAAAGGVAVTFVGIEGALIIDALTYLLSAVLLWPLPLLPPTTTGEVNDRAGFVEGLRYLRRRPILGFLVAQKGMLAFATIAVVMMPLYGEGLFETRGSLWVGALFSCRGIGALLGSLGSRRVLGDAPETMRRWIFGGYGIAALGLLSASVAPGIGWAGLAFGFAWIGVSMVWVYSAILAQQLSDQEYRGRVFSMDYAGFTLTSAGVSFLGGALVDQAGWSPRAVVALGALLVAIPASVWLIGLMTSDVKEYPAAGTA